MFNLLRNMKSDFGFVEQKKVYAAMGAYKFGLYRSPTRLLSEREKILSFRHGLLKKPRINSKSQIKLPYMHKKSVQSCQSLSVGPAWSWFWYQS